MEPHITKDSSSCHTASVFWQQMKKPTEWLKGLKAQWTWPSHCANLSPSLTWNLCMRGALTAMSLLLGRGNWSDTPNFRWEVKEKKKTSSLFPASDELKQKRGEDKKNWEGRSGRRAHFDTFSASKFNFKHWPSLRTSSLAFSLLVWTKIRYTHNNCSSSVIKHIAHWDTQGLNPVSNNLAFPLHTHCSEMKFSEWGNLSEISSCNSCYLTFVTELCFLSVSFSFVISSLK